MRLRGILWALGKAFSRGSPLVSLIYVSGCLRGNGGGGGLYAREDSYIGGQSYLYTWKGDLNMLIHFAVHCIKGNI